MRKIGRSPYPQYVILFSGSCLTARRKAIERLGLPEVRQYRLARCDAEEVQWRRELQTIRQIVPEIRPLLILGINHGSA